MNIKIYGERNCGTNYLEQLIETNLDAKILNFEFNWWRLFLLKKIKYDIVQDFLYRLQRKRTLGWKHGCAPLKHIESHHSDSLVIVTITKNPYSFVNSLYKKPYHIKGQKSKSLSSFIRKEWITRGRDLCNKKILKSPIELWNKKNKSYINLKEQSSKIVINLTYEDLISDPESCIRNLSEIGKISFLNNENKSFKNHTSSTKDSKMTYIDYKEHYLKEEWRSEFNKNDFEFLNSLLNKSTMDYFKYEERTKQS